MAQFAYNSSKNATTNKLLFYINYGKYPEIIRTPQDCKAWAQQAAISVTQIHKFHKQLSMDINFLAK